MARRCLTVGTDAVSVGDTDLRTRPFVDRMLSTIDCIARSNANVLITGESGTGKELVAKAIHARGNRRNGPFKAVNCAALPEALFESELFGHEIGAFTGATTRKQGLFEAANGGTLLLDEVTEMPTSSQAKMLRVIQEREVQRLGSLIAMRVDVRVIATSNRHMMHEIGLGNFREDLYYRLNVVPIHVPPLRVRKPDIAILVEHFLLENNRDHCRSIRGISPAAMILLEGYAWPGNVRELENVITRAVVIAGGPILEPDDFPMAAHDKSAQCSMLPAPAKQTIQEAVHDLIIAAYEDEGHNQTRTADRLGITTRTLRNKLYDYHVLVHDVHPLSSLAERLSDHAPSAENPR